jgi:ribosome-binding protein aMBF1 (putative translation factor)
MRLEERTEIMNKAKRERLGKKGWKAGSASEFLNLSPEEEAYVEMKVVLSRLLQARRKERNLTQAGLAERVRSSQSRVAKMEKAEASVSVDLLVRSLFALGADSRDLAEALVVRESAPWYGKARGRKGGSKK